VPPPVPPPAPPRAESPAAAEIAEGMELLQRGSLPAAAASFEKALAKEPSSALAHQRLAYVRFRLSNFQAAKANAEKAVALDPNDSLAFLILGRAREALGDKARRERGVLGSAALEPKVTSSEQLAACALSLHLRAMQAVEKGEWRQPRADLKEVVGCIRRTATSCTSTASPRSS
jgi:Tfp pilus assembly protein PilF